MNFHDQQLEYERLLERNDPGQQDEPDIVDDDTPDPDIEIFVPD